MLMDGFTVVAEHNRRRILDYLREAVADDLAGDAPGASRSRRRQLGQCAGYAAADGFQAPQGAA